MKTLFLLTDATRPYGDKIMPMLRRDTDFGKWRNYSMDAKLDHDLRIGAILCTPSTVLIYIDMLRELGAISRMAIACSTTHRGP
jgi:hypothetical protein